MAAVFMAFDYGERRTGVALGQSITGTARPLETVQSVGKKPNWQHITNLVKEWQPTHLVVGLPAECEENKQLRKKISNFCRELSERYALPIATHDETLSSDEAYHHLKNKRGRTKGRIDKADIDQYAAAILLESWMNTCGEN